MDTDGELLKSIDCLLSHEAFLAMKTINVLQQVWDLVLEKETILFIK